MANLDSNIQVNVILDGPQLTGASFTTLMIAAGGVTFAEQIRFYESAQEVVADTALLPAAAVTAASIAFGQTQRPARVAIGKLPAAVAQVVTHTISAATEGNVYTATINGQEASYTAVLNDTPALVVDGLIDAIILLGEPVTTNNLGASFTVTANTAGTPFTYVAGGTDTEEFSAVTSTPNLGVGEGLDAILAESEEFFGVALLTRTRIGNLQLAQWCEANGRMGFAQSNDAQALVSGDTDNAASDLEPYENSSLWWHADNDSMLAVAVAADRLSVDPDERTTIWSYLSPQGVTPSALTTTQRNALFAKNGNVLGRLRGVPATFGGTAGSGRKLDLVVTKFWLQVRLAERLSQLLLDASNAGSKLPYTDAGLGRVQAVAEGLLAEGETNGHLRPGSSSVQMPDLAEISSQDLNARLLRFGFTAIPAGAIEGVSLNGFVSFSI